MLGYLAAGLMIGPVLGLVGSETEDLQHFAEYGVVLMLFLIGLEMQPKTLWDMRSRLLGLGGLQVGVTLAAISLLGVAVGLPWNQALAVGIILCLSSTAIVMQTLNEKKLARSDGGRAALRGAAVPGSRGDPAAGAAAAARAGAAPPAWTSTRRWRRVAGWVKALMVLGVVAAVILGGRFLTRPMFRFIGMARLPEIQTAAALLLVVAISTALGAARVCRRRSAASSPGWCSPNSEYRHELESRHRAVQGAAARAVLHHRRRRASTSACWRATGCG